MGFVDKKIIFGVLLIACIFLVFSNFSQSANFDKIDENVLRALDIEGKVRVVVQLEENFNEGLKVFSERGIDKNSRNWFSEELSEKDIRDLSLRKDVKQIVYDYEIVPLLNDVTKLVNSTIVWDISLNGLNLTGEGQSICIIDTGANYSHSDLGGGIGEGYKVIAGHDFGENDDDPMDYQGHGTHVAGIAAASGKYNGTARGANLVILKVFNDAGGGSSSDMVSAVEWCTNNASKYNISVISMSLGLSTSGVPILKNGYCDGDYIALSNAINNAVAKNITVSVAAGNEGNYTHIGMPACMEKAIPVIWGTKSYGLNSGGNRNNMSLLFAPGTSVISTSKQGAGVYETKSGSSMSTPAVAGLIAIINQYLTSANRTKTPQEIELLLNSTGIQVFDSNTNLTFSHTDIYSALDELDEESPEVYLERPLNGTSLINSSYSFVCNSSDTFLKNITFYLWNSSLDVVFENNIDVEGNDFYALETNVSNLDYGDYEWNCYSSDRSSNGAFAFSNYSLNLKEIIIELDSPSDGAYIDSEEINFNCSSEVNSNYEINNVTFYLWNSSDEYYIESKEIFGNSNVTSFNYSNLQNGNYEWNCFVTNNISRGEFAISNYTFEYDITSPKINLISPSNASSYVGIQTLTLSYNVSDDSNISNCSLVVDGIVVDTNLSIINLSESHSFVKTFSSTGNYLWSVNCTNIEGNVGGSTLRTLIITSEEVTVPSESSGGGSSGGSSSPTTMTFIPTTLQLIEGYNRNLQTDDKVKFNIPSATDSEQHTITLKGFQENYANILIESEPLELTLVRGIIEKIDISSNGFYDISIAYYGLVDKKANFTIQRINGIVPEVEEELVELNDTIIKSDEMAPPERFRHIGDIIKTLESFGLKRERVYLISAFLVFLIIGLYIYLRMGGLNQNKKKKLNNGRNNKKNKKRGNTKQHILSELKNINL